MSYAGNQIVQPQQQQAQAPVQQPQAPVQQLQSQPQQFANPNTLATPFQQPQQFEAPQGTQVPQGVSPQQVGGNNNPGDAASFYARMWTQPETALTGAPSQQVSAPPQPAAGAAPTSTPGAAPDLSSIMQRFGINPVQFTQQQQEALQSGNPNAIAETLNTVQQNLFAGVVRAANTLVTKAQENAIQMATTNALGAQADNQLRAQLFSQFAHLNSPAFIPMVDKVLAQMKQTGMNPEQIVAMTGQYFNMFGNAIVNASGGQSPAGQPAKQPTNWDTWLRGDETPQPTNQNPYQVPTR